MDSDTVISYVVGGVVLLSFLGGAISGVIESIRGKRGVDAARGGLQDLEQKVAETA